MNGLLKWGRTPVEGGRVRASQSGRVRLAIGLTVALLPAIAVATAGPTSAAGFTEPKFASFTLQGCRNDGSITFGQNGPFICPDSAYTTGNLGKGWNELDLVPHRLTTSLGSQGGATTTYNVYVAADYQTSGKTGYDLISAPAVNTGLSDASCSVSAGPQSTQGSTSTPFGGGTDVVIYRQLTISQATGTTCVLDYYQRLALGAHLYSGSSLQSYMFTQEGLSGSKKTISIPVNEIKPQSLSKDMTATQGAGYTWNVSKGTVPVNIPFGDTCDSSNTRTAQFSVTVSWSRNALTPSGVITVTTDVYATNPASRTIDVSVSDVVRSGTTPLYTVSTASPVSVPANTANLPVLSDTRTVAAGTTNLNDVATGTYTDEVTGLPIPGSTTATASATVQPLGPFSNPTATISDVITFSGTPFQYKVATSGAGATGGSWDNSYVEGTWVTTSPLTWTSGSQSGASSVTFTVDLRVPAATVAAGTISDQATVNGSDGFTASTPTRSSSLSSSALGTANVSKDMNQTFTGGKTFNFQLWKVGTGGATDSQVGTASVTIAAGSTSGTSTSVTGLDTTASYYWKEAATAPFAAKNNAGSVAFALDGTLASCAVTSTVHNNADPATARVRKVTIPDSTTSWQFQLSGPGVGASGTETVNVTPISQSDVGTTPPVGYVAFTSTLATDGGTYTITEMPTSSQGSQYDLTGVTGDIGGNAVSTNMTAKTCSFTLNLTNDSAKVFECTFTNTQRGKVTLTKTMSGAAIPSGSADSFPFTLTGGPDTVTVSRTANGTNQGIGLDFGWLKPSPPDYTLCEQQLGVAWSSMWQYRYSDDGGTTWSGWTTVTPVNPDAPSQDLGTRCYTFTLIAGRIIDFAVDNRPPPGGGQRTIGYWKNWNSQARTSTFLARHPDHFTVDDFIGPNHRTDLAGVTGTVMLGNVTVDTVSKAVAILSYASMKYAEHGLAAQLLAAKLNVLAGAAPSCTSINAVITQADSLLVAVGWSNANYATSKIVGSGYYLNSTVNRAAFNTVQSTLDAYNNGNCP